MTRTCYFCAAKIIDAGGHSACPECGMSYPFIPAVEPDCSAPAASPRRGLPAAGQLASGSDATSSPPSTAGAFYTHSARFQVCAEAAPAHGEQAPRRARRNTPHGWQAGADTAPGAGPQAARGRASLPAVEIGDVLGAAALAVALFAGMLIGGVL